MFWWLWWQWCWSQWVGRRLRSHWFLVGIPLVLAQWWWCSWVWQSHVSSPIVWSHKSSQNFTHTSCLKAAQQLEIIFGFGFRRCWIQIFFGFGKFGAKHGHFGSFYVLGMNVCKKVGYPLIWGGWDSLWEDVKGWGHKKGRGGINLIFARFGVGCQPPVDTTTDKLSFGFQQPGLSQPH